MAKVELQDDLDEFAFRFNRRRAGSRGLLFRRLLEQTVQTNPLTYRSLVANPAPKPTPPRPRPAHQANPPSLAAHRHQLTRVETTTGSVYRTQMESPHLELLWT